MYRSKFRRAARVGASRGRLQRRGTGTSSYVRRGTQTINQQRYGQRRRTGTTPLRLALTGYAKDVERKYHDKVISTPRATLQIDGTVASAGGTQSAAMVSNTWYKVSAPGGAPVTTGQNAWHGDLLKGIPQGSNATSRIGNKISVKYIKGNIVLTANMLTVPSAAGPNHENTVQMGEGTVPGTPGGTGIYRFLRTTYRVVVVRDLQVNSTNNNVFWGDVFSNQDGTAGLLSELNVGNLGRFRILMDKMVELDADDPQKIIPFMFRNVGTIRYNGPDEPNLSLALTDNGIYVVWASLTTSVELNAGIMHSSQVTVNSRICFTDS